MTKSFKYLNLFLILMFIFGISNVTCNQTSSIDTLNKNLTSAKAINETLAQDNFKQKLENLRNLVNKFYLPFIVTIGLIGNTFTIIIMSKESFLLRIYDSNLTFKQNIQINMEKLYPKSNTKQNLVLIKINDDKTCTGTPQQQQAKNKKANTNASSSNIFIFSLAISDLIYNIVLALLCITRAGLNILNINYVCQISIAVTYICSFLSAAFTTLFTFQRFIAVIDPLRSATSVSLHSRTKIKRIILVLIAFSVVIYSFSLFMYDAEPKKDHESSEAQPICGFKENFSNLVHLIDNTVDSFLTLIVPAISILVMNVAIIKSISSYDKSNILSKDGARKREKSYMDTNAEIVSGTHSESSLNRIENFNSEIEGFNKFEGDHTRSSNGWSNISNLKHQDGKGLKTVSAAQNTSSSSSHITKTLLTVSFAFILLNSPFRLSRLITHIRMSLQQNYIYSDFEFIVNEVLINLYFTSYSVNFFLYSLCGKRFRDSFKALVYFMVFGCYKRFFILFNNIFKRK